MWARHALAEAPVIQSCEGDCDCELWLVAKVKSMNFRFLAAIVDSFVGVGNSCISELGTLQITMEHASNHIGGLCMASIFETCPNTPKIHWSIRVSCYSKVWFESFTPWNTSWLRPPSQKSAISDGMPSQCGTVPGLQFEFSQDFPDEKIHELFNPEWSTLTYHLEI